MTILEMWKSFWSKIPRKRGRPRTGKAISDAERMRQYRARKQAQGQTR